MINSEVADQLRRIREAKSLKLSPSPFVSGEIRNFEGKIVPVTVRNYQVIGILLELKMAEFILGDEPGLGKTLQMLYGPGAMLRHWYPHLKVLWVGPKSTLAEKVDEINVLLSGGIRGKFIESGKGKQHRLRQWKQVQISGTEIALCNYATLRSDYVEIAQTYEGFPLVVIFDEVHNIANTSAKVHKAAYYVAQRAVRRYGISATIIRNRLEEAYGVFRVINPDLFPNKEWFRNAYCIYEEQYVGYNKTVRKLVGYKNLEDFRKRISPYFIARTPADVGDELPEIVPRKILLDMEGKQAKKYDELMLGVLKRKVENPLTGEDIEVPVESALQKLMTSMLITNALQNLDEYKDLEELSSKEKKIVELLKGDLEEEKVVIFSFFKGWLYRLRNIIRKEVGFNPLLITGDQSGKERDQSEKNFNRSDKKDHRVILITTAGKEGINLTAGHYMILANLPWSYGDFRQLVGRIARMGSGHAHVVALMLLNRKSVDEHIFDVLHKKQNLSQALISDSMTNLELAEASEVKHIVQMLEQSVSRRKK